MSDWIILTVAGFLSGAAGAMGLGGGGFLMIYLTLFANTSQADARGINLIFFLPCALVSVLFHRRTELIEREKVKGLIVWGVLGALTGTVISYFISTELLGKIFALFLLILGTKTVVGCAKGWIDERKGEKA